MKPHRARRAPEKAVERKIDELCALAGCTAIRFSQARATNQTPGIPDRLYFHCSSGLAFWVEVKAPGGRQSDAQMVFQHYAAMCRMHYILGGYREVLQFLIDRGLWRLPAGVTVDDVARPAA